MRNKIIGLGEILWDILPQGKKLGGAPANFAYHAGQFDMDSYAVSAIGRDELGQEILEQLSKKNMSVHLEKTDYPTGSVIVELNEAGVPQYDIKTDVAWDNIPFTPEIEELAKQTKAVCFGSLAQRSEVSRNTIHRFLDMLPKDDTLRIFDINLRQSFYDKNTLEESMLRCNILKINDDELLQISSIFGLLGLSLEKKCEAIILKYNLNMLILTCGENGSYVFHSNTVSFLHTPVVKVADTVGAGDSFTAAFCAAILKNKTVNQAHCLAVEVSAYVCTQKGAMPELPHELIQKIK